MTEHIHTSPQPKPNKRLWEIDAVRGIAIIMMVVYHLMWDLLYFGILSNVTLQQGFWKYFQRTTASTFILLVGVSLAISVQSHGATQELKYKKLFRRGLNIFGWGMFITLVTRALGMGRIDFGVLHLIGFSIIISYPFLHFRWLNIGLWALFNAVGYILQSSLNNKHWFVWLGIRPSNYVFLDYFPVIPWFGVVLLGIGLGNIFYHDNVHVFSLPDLSHRSSVQLLRWFGRHSLAIYLLHQPILFGLTMVLSMI